MTITDCRLTANERSGRWNQTSLAVPRYACLPSSGATAEGWLPPFRLLRSFCASDAGALLGRVGQTIKEVPRATHLDKRFIQKSYRGDLSRPPDDLLTGLGVFYVTEQRRLFLDCTAGHYQMTWGYSHPRLTALVREALDAGIVWDDHSNIPGNTVKQLSVRLVEAANGRKAGGSALLDDDKALNTVLLGVCTGSVAANGALKIALKHHQVVRPGATPVLIALRGNYHGTDFLAQRLRGMWKEYFRGITVVEIEPNDTDALRETFTRHRGRVAGIFLELVMMNREAILLDDEFVHAARALCDQADACLVIDEIQTGFWFPRCFLYHEYGILPDILIVGKGMTAGLHPLSRAGLPAEVRPPGAIRYDQHQRERPAGSVGRAGLYGAHCGRSQTDRQHEPPLF